jgi:hypothetical protein
MRSPRPVVLLLTLLAVALTLGLLRGEPEAGLARLIAPHRQSILAWEAGHFLDKWLARVGDALWPGPSREQRLAQVEEFFALGEQARAAQGALARTLAREGAGREADALAAEASALEARREALAPVVEETLEAAISAAADGMDIPGRLGPVRWPPVDFTFERGGLVLVRSPRDAVVRLTDALLRPDVSVLEQVALEAGAEALAPQTSALVVRIGGVATYPSQVSPDRDLRATLRLAAHEWAHHWLIFRPLGRRWFDGGELQAVNEVAADVLGEEVGDAAYTLLTGIPVERPPWTPPAAAAPTAPEPGVFDYTRQMRATRLRLDELLAAGDVAGAEAYLEERRLVFVAQGYAIRRLNTAWFAFYGTYGGGAGGSSPIEAQLRHLRADAGSLAAFLDRVDGITREGELETLAREAGWAPAPVLP